MDKHRKMIRARSVFALCFGIFALALLAPVAANAQVTVFHVKVQIDGVTYCDNNTTGCDVQPWNFGAPGTGVTLPVNGNTLVLTQGGLISGVGGNFDTSDRAKSTTPTTNPCNTAGACPVNIFIAFTDNPITAANLVYTNAGATALNGFNVDPGNFTHLEGVQYTDVSASLIGAPPIELGLGYADTEHNGGTSTLVACTSTTYVANNGSLCVPTPWDPAHVPTGGSAATKFIGGYLTDAQLAALGATSHCDSLCIDGGALLITANAPVGTCPLTQGFWKNHPAAWPVSVLTIGGTPYTKAQLITILQTPPAGGNAVLILGHQLIAALLNIANGAIAPASVTTAIAQAQALLAGVPGGLNGFVAAGSTLGGQMTALADILDSFNSGNLTSVCTGPS